MVFIVLSIYIYIYNVKTYSKYIIYANIDLSLSVHDHSICLLVERRDAEAL